MVSGRYKRSKHLIKSFLLIKPFIKNDVLNFGLSSEINFMYAEIEENYLDEMRKVVEILGFKKMEYSLVQK